MIPVETATLTVVEFMEYQTFITIAGPGDCSSSDLGLEITLAEVESPGIYQEANVAVTTNSKVTSVSTIQKSTVCMVMQPEGTIDTTNEMAYTFLTSSFGFSNDLSIKQDRKNRLSTFVLLHSTHT